MKQLLAILAVICLVTVACAQGEENGPGGPDAASNADARPGNFPDANMSLPDARIVADARQFPDAGPLPDAGGDGTCTVDADCGVNGCCFIVACFPIPGPCQP